jgi:hypothetical protein
MTESFGAICQTRFADFSAILRDNNYVATSYKDGRASSLEEKLMEDDINRPKRPFVCGHTLFVTVRASSNVKPVALQEIPKKPKVED